MIFLLEVFDVFPVFFLDEFVGLTVFELSFRLSQDSGGIGFLLIEFLFSVEERQFGLLSFGIFVLELF